MARNVNILCGFEMPEFERVLSKTLLECGLEASFQVRTTKARVKEYVDRNTECEVVILREKIGTKKWTAEEIAQLTEERDVNVIIVLSGRYQGKEFLKTLLVANVTNAILQKGRNDGASAKDIAQLIVRRRSRREARSYYGLEGKKLELGSLDEDTYMEYYEMLHKEGNSLICNYIICCREMSPQQIADFTRKLPETELSELVQYEEFHTVMGLLKGVGLDLKIKKPKKTQIGMNTPLGISFGEKEKNGDSDKSGMGDGEKKMERLLTDEEVSKLSAADLMAYLNGTYIPHVGDSGENVENTPNEAIEESVVEEIKEDESEDAQILQKPDIEKIRFEEQERAKEEYERKLDDLKRQNEEALRRQKEELNEKKIGELKEKNSEYQHEKTAYEKEIKQLKKKLNKAEEEDYILDAGGKQFSFGLILVMVLLVAGLLAFLYFKPVLMAAILPF